MKNNHEEQKLELEKLFKIYINYNEDSMNWGSLFEGLDIYFNFIASTKPLNQIAQDLFLERNNSNPLSEVYALYQKIVFDKQQSKNLSLDVRNSKSSIKIFHRALLSKINGEQTKGKRFIILHAKENSNQIYFEDDKINSYAFKGTEPNRFKVILLLFKSNKPKTVKDILTLLKKDEQDVETQNNLRREIVRINESFREKCNSEKDIIISQNTKSGRNVFLLNRDDFEYKKD